MAQYIYTMIGVSKTVPPDRKIIRDISLSFFPGAKIGVIGLNGAGKSTLLKIMAGLDDDFIGEAKPDPSVKVGYLAQEPSVFRSLTVEGDGDSLIVYRPRRRPRPEELETFLEQGLEIVSCFAGAPSSPAMAIGLCPPALWKMVKPPRTVRLGRPGKRPGRVSTYWRRTPCSTCRTSTRSTSRPQ